MVEEAAVRQDMEIEIPPFGLGGTLVPHEPGMALGRRPLLGEPVTLDEVVALARDWFTMHLGGPG